ncbi:MAG: ArsR/SmtB family transcription factor [Janthinobacterium lividum]
MDAMTTMSALSQATRLAVFRRLVDALPEGMASGEIAEATDTSPNSMSAHLAVLSRAGLVASERSGRSAIYRALPGPAIELSKFLAVACVRRADR